VSAVVGKDVYVVGWHCVCLGAWSTQHIARALTEASSKFECNLPTPFGPHYVECSLHHRRHSKPKKKEREQTKGETNGKDGWEFAGFWSCVLFLWYFPAWERPPSRHALCRPSLDPLFGFPSTMFPSFDRFFSLSLVFIQPMDYMPGRDTHSHVSVSQANFGRA